MCSCFPTEKQTKAVFSLTQMDVNDQSEAKALLAFKRLLIVPQVSGRLGGRYWFLCCLYWVPLCLRMLIYAVCSPCLVLKFWKSSLDNCVRMQSYRCVFCFFANPLRLIFIVSFWTYFDFYILWHCRTRCPLVMFGSQAYFFSFHCYSEQFSNRNWTAVIKYETKYVKFRGWITQGPSQIHLLFTHNSWKHRDLRMSHLVLSNISATNNSSVWQDCSVTCSKDEDCGTGSTQLWPAYLPRKQV